jgi:hypothetical protein
MMFPDPFNIRLLLLFFIMFWCPFAIIFYYPFAIMFSDALIKTSFLVFINALPLDPAFILRFYEF